MLKIKTFFASIILVILVMGCNKGSGRYETRLPVRFTPLDVGAIKPEGWLRDWAEDAANGITGHLDEYEQVFAYGWLGRDISARQSEGDGMVSSTGWLLEQSAYWLDGALKLGYQLGDTAIIRKTTRRLDGVVDGVLSSPNHTFIWWKTDDIVKEENGDEGKGSFNNWAHGLMGRCLVSYYQATGDERILKALEKVYSSGYFLKPPQDDIYGPEAGLTQGMVRGAVNLDAMTETYLLTGNGAILQTMLDYAAEPTQKDQEQRLLDKKDRYDRIWQEATIHGVTFNEVARVPALLALWTGDRKELEATIHILEWGDRYNGLPYGVVSAEEWISGIGPYRFTETCDIPAAMWTKTWLLRITGDARWADQVERAFLNAGPVPVSRDFKTMSYYQSPNRIDEDTPAAPPVPGPGRQIVYSPTGNKTLCCVGSSNWIIPNYVQNMCMAAAGGGYAFALYGPCSIEADGLKFTCTTAYPFGDEIRINLKADKAQRIPLYFRVPEWCEGMTVTVNGKSVSGSYYGRFLRVKRKWQDGDEIVISLPMQPRVYEVEDNCYPQNSYFTKPQWGRVHPYALDTLAGRKYTCVDYGPLLYALPLYDIDENTVVPGQKSDYELAVEDASQIEVVRNGEMPARWGWRIEDVPTVLKVPALENEDGRSEPAMTNITLVPYNCTKFRVSMFPQASR